MATLSSVIVPAKILKDGRHKIRISVAHNGETRYIVTDIVIDSAKEFKNGSIVKRSDATFMNTKLRGILQRYQEIIDNLPYVNGFTCAELVYQIKTAGDCKHRTLSSIFDEYIKTARIKESTVHCYSFAWKSLSKILNPDMIVDNITHGTAANLIKELYDRKLSEATIRLYYKVFIALVNYAKRCGYVQFRVNPFVGLEIPRGRAKKSWLSVEEIKKVRDLKTDKRNLRLCRDIFMLSYYLGGINAIDLVKVNFNEHPDTLIYVRTKTDRLQKANEFVEFEIPEEAKEIINRYKGDDGRLAFSDYQRKNKLQQFFQFNIPQLREATSIKQLIYYSARKSFAQHAFNLGVSESVIDFILGHRVDKGGSSLLLHLRHAGYGDGCCEKSFG